MDDEVTVKEDLTDYETVFCELLKRAIEVETVALDENGESVYVGPVEREGTQIYGRYRLSDEAKRFLLGEFPLDEMPDSLLLKAP